MLSLTEKQEQVLDFLKSYSWMTGYPPTVREIGAHFGFLWPAARQHLKALERKNYIRLNPSRARGIEIPGLEHKKGVMVPVAGTIRAGAPILAVEDIDNHILIDRTLFPADNVFSLEVKGDSMIEAGILEGDYVLVKPQETIDSGAIGVVLINDEATVKRVLIEGEMVVLRPENKGMEPMAYQAGEVSIIGRVIGLIRQI